MNNDEKLTKAYEISKGLIEEASAKPCEVCGEKSTCLTVISTRCSLSGFRMVERLFWTCGDCSMILRQVHNANMDEVERR